MQLNSTFLTVQEVSRAASKFDELISLVTLMGEDLISGLEWLCDGKQLAIGRDASVKRREQSGFGWMAWGTIAQDRIGAVVQEFGLTEAVLSDLIMRLRSRTSGA